MQRLKQLAVVVKAVDRKHVHMAYHAILHAILNNLSPTNNLHKYCQYNIYTLISSWSG